MLAIRLFVSHVTLNTFPFSCKNTTLTRLPIPTNPSESCLEDIPTKNLISIIYSEHPPLLSSPDPQPLPMPSPLSSSLLFLHLEVTLMNEIIVALNDSLRIVLIPRSWAVFKFLPKFSELWSCVKACWLLLSNIVQEYCIFWLHIIPPTSF
jgi:hypothetical protein